MRQTEVLVQSYNQLEDICTASAPDASYGLHVTSGLLSKYQDAKFTITINISMIAACGLHRSDTSATREEGILSTDLSAQAADLVDPSALGVPRHCHHVTLLGPEHLGPVVHLVHYSNDVRALTQKTIQVLNSLSVV